MRPPTTHLASEFGHERPVECEHFYATTILLWNSKAAVRFFRAARRPACPACQCIQGIKDVANCERASVRQHSEGKRRSSSNSVRRIRAGQVPVPGRNRNLLVVG